MVSGILSGEQPIEGNGAVEIRRYEIMALHRPAQKISRERSFLRLLIMEEWKPQTFLPFGEKKRGGE